MKNHIDNNGSVEVPRADFIKAFAKSTADKVQDFPTFQDPMDLPMAPAP